MLAVIVPPNKLVLATISAILAEPESIRPTTLAAPAFNCVLAVTVPPNIFVFAVIVPPNKLVLATISAILAEPASIRPTTLADPTFN